VSFNSFRLYFLAELNTPILPRHLLASDTVRFERSTTI
jgi:hypothetical protein